jgi:hypothetical protein
MDNEKIAYRNLTLIQNILERTPIAIGSKNQEELLDTIRKYRREFHTDNVVESKNEWKAIKRILDIV